MTRAVLTVAAAVAGLAVLAALVALDERRWRRRTRAALRLLPGVGDRLAAEALAWLADREEQGA